MASYVALQPHYNLMERDYERELAPLCERHGLACLPVLRPRAGLPHRQVPARRRARSTARARRGCVESYFNERGFAVLDALDEIAAAHDAASRRWRSRGLRAQPTVLAPIASATSPEQLAELLAFSGLELSAEELGRLDRRERA